MSAPSLTFLLVFKKNRMHVSLVVPTPVFLTLQVALLGELIEWITDVPMLPSVGKALPLANC